MNEVQQFKPGDRIRLVHTFYYGTVVGWVYSSQVDGGPRQDVMWDHNKKTTAYDPVFYRSKEDSRINDPEIVSSGNVTSYKYRQTYIDPITGDRVVRRAGMHIENDHY